MNGTTFLGRLKKLGVIALSVMMLTSSALSISVNAAQYGGDSVPYSDVINTGDKLYPGDILSIFRDGSVYNTPYSTVAYFDYDGKLLTVDGFVGDTSGKSHTVLKYTNAGGKQSKTFVYWKVTYGDVELETSGRMISKAETITTPCIKLTAVADDFVPTISIKRPLVQLSRTDVTGYTGKTLDLDYKWFNMTEPKVTWASSDESVATVDSDGVVTFVAKGKATITLDVENYGQLKCTVNVKTSGLRKR